MYWTDWTGWTDKTDWTCVKWDSILGEMADISCGWQIRSLEVANLMDQMAMLWRGWIVC